MKILSVRFQNLNSLPSAWSIDFTHPVYVSDGIFAITGPTGAGKTTILDAICLGLYGRTPRLDRVTKSSNEIMSRQRGECFAEVTFETQKGRYRCHWSQRRARKQPAGELQQARHEIADTDTNAVLENKISQVGLFIEQATGMDFERFTRSMLLAQGGFAAFLQAPPDERSPILEQITGTEIYSQISIKVHERQREEREKLELLSAELKGLPVLDEGEEIAKRVILQEKQTAEKALALQVGELRQASLWLAALSSLEQEITELDSQWRVLERREEDFAPEAARLARARRAVLLEGDYREAMSLRARQTREIREMHEAIAALPAKEQACAAAMSGKQDTEKAAAEARCRQQAGAEILKKVREMDARLSEQKKQINEKDKALSAAAKKAQTHQESIGNSAAACIKLQAGLAACEAYLRLHAVDAALAEKMGVIARGLASLKEMVSRSGRIKKDIQAAARKKNDAALSCRKAEKDAGKYRGELAAQKGEIEALATAMTEILQGRDTGDWLKDADALKDRERLLVQAVELGGRMEQTGISLKILHENLVSSKAVQEKLSEDIKNAFQAKTLLEKELEAKEIQAALLARIQSLEEERKRLADGQPCPLCGATEHPYARGNAPELNQAEAQLKKTRADFRKAADVHNRLENAQVKTAAEIAHAAKDIAEQSAVFAADEKKCCDLLQRLGLEAVSEDRLSKMREALDDVQAAIARTSAVLAAVEEKNRKMRQAQTVLEKIRMQLEKSEKVFHDCRLTMETAGLEHETLLQNENLLIAGLESLRQELMRDAGPFGVEQIPLDGADVLLQNLTARKDLFQAKLADKNVWEKKIADENASLKTEKALLARLEQDLAEMQGDRANLLRESDSLSVLRTELFGRKDANAEEKRLVDDVSLADQAMKKAQAGLDAVEKDLGLLQAKLSSLKDKTDRQAVELAQTEARLTECLRKEGFAGEDDYVSSRLNEEEMKILVGREQSLNRERTELDARRKDRRQALAREREKNLTEQSPEALQEKLAQGESAWKELQENIGAIKSDLAENEKLREKQGQSILMMQARQKECDRWNDLHALIGSSDGKKFRNFAQGLTFELMIRHANQQLMKMTDRYLLMRDALLPLELNVLDSYQAGEIRSTKNLSGGESFLVSLALALGLSQMASRTVRVDSLFLDEGFGTLDEDALETALAAMAGLRQEGKLIGVISHVAALKERIGAQIRVIPQSGGQSILEGPGCLRL